MLELTHNHDRTEPYEEGDGYAHVAFTVDGLEETVERLKSQGVNITLEPKILTADGNDYKIAFVEDPDGYKVEPGKGAGRAWHHEGRGHVSVRLQASGPG